MNHLSLLGVFGIGLVASLAACSSSEKGESDFGSGSSEINGRGPAGEADALVARGRRAQRMRNSLGQIQVSQRGTGASFFANLTLYKNQPPPKCTGRKFGACEVILSTDCPDNEESSQATAGNITFRAEDPNSRNYAPGTEFFTLAAAESYGSTEGYFDFEKVRVHASGDPNGVPAFTASLDLPPFGLVLTTPAIDDGMLADTKKIDIDRTKAMKVEWRPMPVRAKHPGNLNVFLLGFGETVPTEDGGTTQISPDVYIECNFDPKSGSAEIPAEAMATLPVGPGSIDFKLVADRPVPGIERVNLRGQSDVVRPDGTPIAWKSFDNIVTH